jgi:hypothetical protein
MIVSKEASNIGIASRLTQQASQSIAQRNWSPTANQSLLLLTLLISAKS